MLGHETTGDYDLFNSLLKLWSQFYLWGSFYSKFTISLSHHLSFYKG